MNHYSTMNREQLDALHNFLADNHVEDPALARYLQVDLERYSLEVAKEYAANILEKCQFERNIPKRLAEVERSTTSENIEVIVRRTLSHGMPYMIAKVSE